MIRYGPHVSPWYAKKVTSTLGRYHTEHQAHQALRSAQLGWYSTMGKLWIEQL